MTVMTTVKQKVQDLISTIENVAVLVRTGEHEQHKRVDERARTERF